MGIVQRQSLKNTLVNYFGVAIGAISTLFIYPLEWELYGDIQFILSSAILFSAFLALGSHSIVNKYFPYFKKNNINGFLGLTILYCTISIIITSLVMFILSDKVLDFLEFGGLDSNKILDNLFVIYPLGVIYCYITILRAQSFNFKRIVVPDLLTSFSLKIVLPIIIFFGYISLINFNVANYILIISHIIILLSMLYYLKHIGGCDFNKQIFRISFKKHKEILNYMLYGAFNHIGNILVYKIDIVMIGLLLSSVSVGYYSIFLFLSVVVEIPTKSIFQITSPMISKAFQDDDLEEITTIYKKSAINLLIIGVFIIAMIWFNLNSFLSIMTNGDVLKTETVIFIILGATKLIDMITSVNFSIISYSKYFRVNTLFIVILAVANILFNLYFISNYNIIGAAIATGISMFLFNLLKTLFVFIKFKIHPFDTKMLVPILFMIIGVLLPFIFDFIFESMILSIVLSIVYAALYISLIYWLKLSDEIAKSIEKYLKILFVR